ncbi:guanosine-3',5'-bis(diphosphate) 3'-pyrophosphohydrolase [Bacillus toyonensis]|nr:guanosine-3',5'-bis(diphosphate) 3'-pyrophosphohydrolase [Bacillus toyonensis]PHD51761.1 guanosine-3',5'-bis(diphosphate) 3'-pyrophosphohydrolase [Bacillus toyonensis]
MTSKWDTVVLSVTGMPITFTCFMLCESLGNAEKVKSIIVAPSGK